MSIFRVLKHRCAWAAGLVAAVTMLGAAAEAQEVKRKPFQKYFFAGCGTGKTECSGPVYKVPANRRFEVRSVSCGFTVRSPGMVNSVFLAARPTDPTKQIIDYLVPVQTSDQGGFRGFSFNTQTLLVASATDRLLMAVNATEDIFNINCKVAGDLVFLE